MLSTENMDDNDEKKEEAKGGDEVAAVPSKLTSQAPDTTKKDQLIPQNTELVEVNSTSATEANLQNAIAITQPAAQTQSEEEDQGAGAAAADEPPPYAEQDAGANERTTDNDENEKEKNKSNTEDDFVKVDSDYQD